MTRNRECRERNIMERLERTSQLNCPTWPSCCTTNLRSDGLIHVPWLVVRGEIST